MQSWPDIPRYFTAIAECLACYLILLQVHNGKRRITNFWLAPFLCLIQILLQWLVSSWSVSLWLLGMLINIQWMFVCLVILIKCQVKEWLYILCKAFIFSELLASFSWQLYCYIFLATHWDNYLNQIIFMLISFTILSFIYSVLARKLSNPVVLDSINIRMVTTAVITAIIIFSVSNLGFALTNTNFTLGDTTTIFLFRTLIDFCGILLLFLQDNQRYEYHLVNELSAVNNVLHSQYEQYNAYKESTEQLQRRLHDVKHQIEVLELEPSQDKRKDYLSNLKDSLQSYSTLIKTGHPVIDVVLTRKNIQCLENHISLTCITDGGLLTFVDTMDLVSLFGNLLDNAIESSQKITNSSKRVIHLRLSQKANFALFTIENYYEIPVELENGLPKTTKKDIHQHGYGLKSISYIVKKYHGNMTINYQDNWFTVRILLPLPTE